MDKIIKYIVLAVLFAVCVPGVLFKLPYAPWSHALLFTAAWYVTSMLHPVLEGIDATADRIASIEKKLENPKLRPNQRTKLVADLAALKAQQKK
jgi:hypothetical protein